MVESVSQDRFADHEPVTTSDAEGTGYQRSSAPTPVRAPVAEPVTALGRGEPVPSAPVAPAEVAATPTAVEMPLVVRRKRNWKRTLLFALLPAVLVVGCYEYVVGGQVMSTDNAYVQAQVLGLSTDVSGTVIAVEVRNNEAVKKGQVMFRLRPDAFQIALDGADAQLGTVRNQVLTLQASYKQSLAQIVQAKADLPFYETQLKRQQDLVASNAASKAAYDTAEHDAIAGRQRIIVADAQAQSMLAQLGGDVDQPVERNPFYLQAKSMVDNAKRDLNDTVVRAPFDGIVTNVDALQVGAYLPAAQQGFTLVSSDHMWIEASPKETELTWVKPGQPATVSVDTYPGVACKGTVGSINPASGASFSLLPAQNTTGNWVKVVQRIPMRILIDQADCKPTLRVGMSAVVDVDTGHARGIPDMIKSVIDGSRHLIAEGRTLVAPVATHRG